MYFVYFVRKTKYKYIKMYFKYKYKIIKMYYKIQICILDTYFKYLYLKYYPALAEKMMHMC